MKNAPTLNCDALSAGGTPAAATVIALLAPKLPEVLTIERAQQPRLRHGGTTLQAHV